MELNQYLSDSRRKRERRRQIFWRVALGIVIAAIVAGVVWFIGWSPIFRMNGIVVQGNSQVSTDEVISLVNASFAEHHFGFGILGEKNMLAWSTAVPADILQEDPQIASMTLVKKYGAHEIVATITERQPFAIWCNIAPSIAPPANASSTLPGPEVVAAMATGNESCYWFDQSGVLFAPTFDTEGSLLFAIHDYSGANPALGQPILPARFMPNVISIVNVLRMSGLRVKEVRLNDLSLEEIDVTTYNGPDIYFSLRFPADDTLSVLRNLINEPGFGKLQYVDFRTQDRVFYK